MLISITRSHSSTGHVEHRAVRIDAGVGHGDRDGLQRPLRRREKGLHRFFVPHVEDAGEGSLAAQSGHRVLHRVLAQVAQRHLAAGGVERLGDALADAGAGPRDDHHGVAEVEAAHARCLSWHRDPSSQVVNQMPP
jgi:hypothetical protein